MGPSVVQPDEPPLMSDADRRTELEAKLHANWSRGFHEEKDHTYFGKLLDTHVSLEKRVEEQLLIDQFDRRLFPKNPNSGQSLLWFHRKGSFLFIPRTIGEVLTREFHLLHRLVSKTAKGT